jgi:predicted dehydrogenase
MAHGRDRKAAVIGQLAEISAACDLSLEDRYILPIGIIGSGAILDVGHLPAYQAAGIPVPAIWGRTRGHAERLANAHGIGRIHDSLDDLLADPEVAVVDIAITPQAQVDIAIAALEAGKDVICQKPLAMAVADAERIVATADRLGRKVAVQQQMRYEEGMRAAKAMIDRGWIGEVATISFSVNLDTDFGSWGWMGQVPRLEIYFHSIHYLDTIRFFLGEPDAVFGTQWRLPGQRAAGDTRTLSTLIYPGDLRAIVSSNHENPAGDNVATFRIDGSEGSIKGDLGLLADYPHGRPDTLLLNSRVLPTDGWLPYPVTRRWIPDAFLGPVGSLLRAIVDGGEPESGARDNLGTLRLVEALYRSGETGTVVPVQAADAAP